MEMSWHTKKDVLDDLAQLMGNSVKELDEQCFSIGEQPPPPSCAVNELDDEMFLRLHEDGDDVIINEECKGPDLTGITEMLRMVDKYNSSSNVITEKEVINDASITITKYNLKAPEFVPKSSNIGEKPNGEEEKENKIIKVHHTNCGEAKTEKDIKDDSAKLKEISDELRNKISSQSKVACIQVKRERNLAIASLLKLYSNNAPICDTKPKLVTPEHFEKSCKEEHLTVVSQSPQPKLSSPVVSLESGSIGTAQTMEDKNDMDLEIEESVAKVNNWLSNANSQKIPDNKEPTLYLGPVTFKKRAAKNVTTGNSEASDKSKNHKVNNKPTPQGDSFVPSEYASKLSQSYMERVKAKESKSLDIWGKLDRDLKAKDEQINKKQQLAHKSQS